MAEERAIRLDLAARAKFAKDGERVQETRSLIRERTEDPAERSAAESALALGRAAGGGFVEVS